MPLIDLEALGRSKAITGVTDKISEFRGLMQERKSNEMLMESAAIDLRKKKEEETSANRMMTKEAAFQQFAPNATPSVRAEIEKDMESMGGWIHQDGEIFTNQKSINKLAALVGKRLDIQETYMTKTMFDVRQQINTAIKRQNDPNIKWEKGQKENEAANILALENMLGELGNGKKIITDQTQRDKLELAEAKGDKAEDTSNMRNIKHLVSIGYAKDQKEAAKTIYKVSQGLMSKESFLQKGMLGIAKVRYDTKLRESAIDDLRDMADDLFPGDVADRQLEGESDIDQMSYGDPDESATVDVRSRFASDTKMSNYTLGELTENGYEVKDKNGKLLGYYK